jgi:branched-chain amino acid transport system substrate-binding protein
LLAAVVAALVAVAVTATASARPTAAAKSCGTVQIGMMAPITGPAASIGDDQLHWALYGATQWNKSNSPKIKIVQGDTQLDASKASTVAQQFASQSSIMGVIGPAGSDEVQAVAPILKKAGLAFASGSATRVSLSGKKNKGYFFRDVPNDGVQAPTDVAYMMSHLGVKSGSSVVIIDDQESYSTGLADLAQKELKAKGVKVDRESVSQKATDFSSIIAKISSSTKVVFLPFHLASEAQLVAQQMKAQGKTATVFGSDGTFDSANFKAAGAYVSFFAPDVTTIGADKALVAAYKKAYKGGTTPFGAPNYVLAQAYGLAAKAACAKGKVTRASMRAALAKVSVAKTILGTRLKFTANGDVSGAKFFIFKIQSNGSYKTVG